jgi:hypothetical protein
MEKGPPRVLICGDRHYNNYAKIKFFVDSLPIGSVIIEGEAKGADQFARIAAEEKGIPQERILRFPAQWDSYLKKRAGMVRNTQMLDEGKPTIVVAFHDKIEESKGTKNMIEQAISAGLPVLINPDSWWQVDDEK